MTLLASATDETPTANTAYLYEEGIVPQIAFIVDKAEGIDFFTDSRSMKRFKYCSKRGRFLFSKKWSSSPNI